MLRSGCPRFNSRVKLIPPSLRGYRRSWLGRDVLAGATLSAIAIPEVMGYTSIAETPIASGLYTIIFPTIAFALFCSSRLLVVGADSATAAILAAGITGLGVAGLSPNTEEWLAWASLTALACALMLLVARILRLGFLGDFLSTAVLVGFLTGVGVQVLTEQIPTMLGLPDAQGHWLRQQWATLTDLADVNWRDAAFSFGTLAVIVACKRSAPSIPGAMVAVVLAIVASNYFDASAHGVSVVGAMTGGLPTPGLPSSVSLEQGIGVLSIAFSCFILIVSQSAATSRSYAMKRGERVNVNQDILGLSMANLTAGATGTFVVNGSPTKTEVLAEHHGRTQIANITMALCALGVALFATGLLEQMPLSVLATVVFLIGIGLVNVTGLRRIRAWRRSEFLIAATTAAVVVLVGVEQAVILGIALSIAELVRRQYQPARFVIDRDDSGNARYVQAKLGLQSAPGLLVFRYGADLFYANASRFTTEVEALVAATPDPLHWMVLDCSSINDIDYSAGEALSGLVDYVHAHNIHFALTGLDPALTRVLTEYGVYGKIRPDRIFSSADEVFAAYQQGSADGNQPRM